MKKSGEKFWHLPTPIEPQVLEQCVAPGFSLVTTNEAPQMLTVYDSPDWDIWHSDSVFFRRDDNAGVLYTAKEVITQANISDQARFWWDFPEGHLRQALKNRIKLRTLEKKAEMEASHRQCELLNEDAKIVIRLTFSFYKNPGKSSDAYYLKVKALRGYKKEFKDFISLLISFFNEQEINPIDAKYSFRQILTDLGINPVRENNNFGISSNEPAESAIRKMAAIIVERAQLQESIITDTDTEFLHEYRVNLRKARSLINFMKQTLHPEKHRMLKENLAQLASATNTLRDLDVFLLNGASYRALLPERYSDGLDELFKLVAQERKISFRKVVRLIKSQTFSKKMDQVRTELAKEPDYHTEHSSQPVITPAKKKIRRHYHTICRLAAELHDNSPDDDIHKIRIQGKKLRYLMELFAELFPAKQFNKLIKQLKELQNVLGQFNDFSVQKKFLYAYTDPNKHSESMIAAVNGLIAVLHQNQLVERQKVEAALAAFANNKIKTEFDLLFK